MRRKTKKNPKTKGNENKNKQENNKRKPNGLLGDAITRNFWVDAFSATTTTQTTTRTTTRNASRVIAVRQPANTNQDEGGGRDRGGNDPLAQSFIVDEEDGLFVTSLDVFFATKSSTIPVRCEIRNMVNGYPGQKIVPFSQKYLNHK